MQVVHRGSAILSWVWLYMVRGSRVSTSSSLSLPRRQSNTSSGHLLKHVIRWSPRTLGPEHAVYESIDPAVRVSDARMNLAGCACSESQTTESHYPYPKRRPQDGCMEFIVFRGNCHSSVAHEDHSFTCASADHVQFWASLGKGPGRLHGTAPFALVACHHVLLQVFQRAR